MLLLLLILSFFLLALPFLLGAVSVCLVFTKRRKIGLILVGLDVLWISFLLFEAHLNKRSPTGHFARWCMGDGTVVQEVDDQAEDLRASASLPQIQNWAVEIMRRYDSKRLKTAGEASYWSFGSVKLDGSEISPVVSNIWKEAESPEVSIMLSDGKPECVVLASYEKGMLFGDANFISPIQAPNYQKKVVPGVYTYATYK